MLIWPTSQEAAMNVALIPHSILKSHVEAIEAKFLVKVVGLLGSPSGR